MRCFGTPLQRAVGALNIRMPTLPQIEEVNPRIAMVHTAGGNVTATNGGRWVSPKLDTPGNAGLSLQPLAEVTLTVWTGA